MIKDRFGYQSPEIIFPNFFRNRSILFRSIAASNFNYVSRKAPFSELLPSLHLAGRQAQHKYPYKPVEQSVFIVIKYRVSGL